MQCPKTHAGRGETHWRTRLQRCSSTIRREGHTILWKFSDPHPKSFSVSPEFMENVWMPLLASFSSSVSS